MPRKPKILINYDYSAYPGTTASYIEMALRKDPNLDVFRLGEDHLACADFFLNIQPCSFIARMPGRKVGYWEIDNHIVRGQDFQKYNLVDYLFVAQKHFLDLYGHKNLNWLPLGCDPDIHKLYPDEKVIYDIGFVGNDNYPERRKMLDLIGQKYKLLRTTAAPGEEYSRKFSQCKMIFNWAMDNDMNMRFFEAMSIGRLLITDKVEGQDDLFSSINDYCWCRNWEEIDYSIDYWLKHPERREEKAKSGHDQAVRYNTYKDRAYKMLEIMGL
jgi:spore maturation protein CgeB